eukprot:Rmarinus@m.3273
MARALVVLVVALALACTSFARSDDPGKRTLVLLDSSDVEDTHSEFFSALKKDGHNLTFEVADSSNAVLHEFGEYLYDNLVLFSPEAEDFANFGMDDVLEFIDQGGNVIIAGSFEMSDAMRDLANECGVEFDEQGTAAIDEEHAHSLDSKYDGESSVFTTKNVIKNSVIVGQKTGPILFYGLGHALLEDNPLVMTVVGGESTTTSIDPEDPNAEPFVSGRDTGLVSVLQARNNARVLVTGSLDLCSDDFFAVKDVGNKQLCTSLARWVFGDSGRLRSRNAEHHLVKPYHSAVEPMTSDVVGCRRRQTYTINDEVEFSVIIEEYKDGKWVPFHADDVQLEFVMLNPYLRTTLSADDAGRFSSQFRLPDVYGVFKFRLDYRRLGYSFLFEEDLSPVRPLRHNQFERFIPMAYPYYASALSMMVGLFLFSWVFLYTK